MTLQLHSFALALSLFFQTSAGQDVRALEPNKLVEREIAGGESHTYQIELQAGQFARFRLGQRALDVVLLLNGPDGKQLSEVNLTGLNRLGEQEALSLEAPVTGSYRLTVRGTESAVLRGSYRLEAAVRAAVTAEDRQRLKAEALLVEANELIPQADRTAQQVIEKAQQALPLWRELGEPHWTAYALSLIGAAYLDLNQFGKALEHFEQALPIHREIKNRQGEARALNNLGNAYYDLGRYEKAIEHFEQALLIHREIKNQIGIGGALNFLGLAYSSLNRYEKAIEYFEQALALAREVKNLVQEGNALNNLGLCYSKLGRHEIAIEYYEQVVTMKRQVKNRSHEGAALNNLGNAYFRAGRYEKAIECSAQALAIAREVKHRLYECDSLRSLGDASFSLGRNEEAANYLGQSLLIAREIKLPVKEAEALSSLAAVEMRRGNLARARTLIEECLQISESQRIEAISPESRFSFLAGVQISYQLYTDLLMRQHKAEPTKGFDALAVETSERQRARSLLDLLVESRADVRQGVDPALLERERLLGRQLNDKARLLTEASRPEQVAALKQEISQLENDYERAQAAIRKASPHYAALTQPQPLTLKEIQAQLDADTLLLEYALGEQRSYLWAITKDSLRSYELPKGEVIEKGARHVHELLSARSTTRRGESALERQERITRAEAALPAAAQSLSQILLAPVAAQLGNKRLVVVADGALQYLPFAMLPEPVGGKSRPLVVSHEVVSLPSASALAIQRAELADRQPAPKMLAVIADPVFDRTDARFKSPTPAASDKEQARAVTFDDERRIEHLAEKSDDKSGATRRLIIPRLPFTREEANRLIALTPKNSSFAAIDFQANRETVLRGELSQYRYVHFATHGLLDAERPGFSSLVLSMVDDKGQSQNGFLRANDIYNLKLPAELVVLSACQTGLGQEIKGEGLVGLTRGFMYAGAARVVVSLWNVSDKATAELMTKFYERMLKEGARPAAALRAAQVEMWKQKQWQSPYYWAAFTLQGEWR